MKELLFAFCFVALGFTAGCRDSRTDHGHAHDGENAHSHEAGTGHDHAPPHGGTPVIVEEDKFHLELVLDTTAGKMQAYVLDGHLESYVQVPETSFVLVAKLDGGVEQLAFQRLPEPVSGNVPARSSLFEAQADWLRSAKEFKGNIPAITLNGMTFTNLSFDFPQGSKHVH